MLNGCLDFNGFFLVTFTFIPEYKVMFEMVLLFGFLIQSDIYNAQSLSYQTLRNTDKSEFHIQYKPKSGTMDILGW